MTERHATIEPMIREIRTAFNQLKGLAEHLHADLGITPSMRAVLEAFVRNSPRTVPDVAREKGVSRQHVQSIVNTLVECGLLAAVDNPDHKRSPLYQPSTKGQRLFAEICSREAAPLAEIAAALPETAVADATRLLARLNDILETLTTKGD